MILAPFVSEASAGRCLRAGVGYLDLAGNCEIAFGNVFIRMRGGENPKRERRELRSLFTPQAAQILQTLLTPPARAWKVAELAEFAGASLGHASNVRRRLLELELATSSAEGLLVSRPEALFGAWKPTGCGSMRVEHPSGSRASGPQTT